MAEASTFVFIPGSLKEHGSGLWSLEGSMKSSVFGPACLGPRFSLRMCVAKLKTGNLLVISPFLLDKEALNAIDKIGTVAFILAPNGLHYLFTGKFKEIYPNAVLIGTERCREKAPSAGWNLILPKDEIPSEITDTCDVHVMTGFDWLQEVVVCHRPSRTLMVVDLAMNFKRGHDLYGFTFPWNILVWLADGYRPCQLMKDFFFVCNDPMAAKESFDVVLGWDFDRLMMSHGQVVETGGKEALRCGSYARICGWAGATGMS